MSVGFEVVVPVLPAVMYPDVKVPELCCHVNVTVSYCFVKYVQL